MKFKVSVVDPTLDIFDNEYCEIKLHRYTSIKHFEEVHHDHEDDDFGEFTDETIDLVICNEDGGDLWNKAQLYCPDYKDTDFLYGDYDQ